MNKLKLKELFKGGIIRVIIISLFSTLACIGIIKAATNIGSNISTDGTITGSGANTLYGATSIGGALTATSTLNVTGLTTLGNASTTLLSVSSNAYLATTTIAANDTSVFLIERTNGNDTFRFNTTDQTLSIYNESASVHANPLRVINYNDGLNSIAGIGFYKYGGTEASPENLDLTSFTHIGGLVFYPYFNNAFNYAYSIATLISPTWNYVTHATQPESFMHFGTWKDNVYLHSFEHGPNGTFTTKHNENYSDYLTDKQLTVSGDAEIYNSDTLGSEVLSSNSTYNVAAWTKGTNWVTSGPDAIFAVGAGGGSGNLSQVEASFASQASDNRRYLINVNFQIVADSCGVNNANLSYIRVGTNFVVDQHSEADTIWGNNGEIIVNSPTVGWADQANGIRFASCSGTGCQRVYQGASNISSFDIQVSATGACTIIVTDASVKEVLGGDLTVHGKVVSTSLETNPNDASATPAAPTKKLKFFGYNKSLGDDANGVCDTGVDCITLPIPTTQGHITISDGINTLSEFIVTSAGAVKPQKDNTITETFKINAADIKLLAGTPLVLVAAPGSVNTVEIVSAYLTMIGGSEPLTEVSDPDDLAIKYDNGSGAQILTFDTTNFITTASVAVQTLYATNSPYSAAVANKNVVLINTGTNYGGNASNDGYMLADVTYRIHRTTGVVYSNRCTTGTTGNLCVYDAGANAVILNDYGATSVLNVEMWYD